MDNDKLFSVPKIPNLNTRIGGHQWNWILEKPGQPKGLLLLPNNNSSLEFITMKCSAGGQLGWL